MFLLYQEKKHYPGPKLELLRASGNVVRWERLQEGKRAHYPKLVGHDECGCCRCSWCVNMHDKLYFILTVRPQEWKELTMVPIACSVRVLTSLRGSSSFSPSSSPQKVKRAHYPKLAYKILYSSVTLKLAVRALLQQPAATSLFTLWVSRKQCMVW